jgi:phosphatidylserine decarboxylase
MKMPTKSSDTFIISKYGYKKILCCLAIVLLCGLFHLELLFTVGIFCLLFLLYIYRNPERETPYFQDNSIVSPVDGKVIMIETLDDGFVVMIQSTILDTSILRSAISSPIKLLKKVDGSRLPVELKKSRLLNEQAVLEFDMEQGIRIEHIASTSSEAIQLASLQGHAVHQGTRYGYLNSGLTSIYLPKSSRISVQRLETVKAGQTLIGYIS